MNTEKDMFLSYWNGKFLPKLRSKMISASKNQTSGHSLMCNILKESALDWGNEYIEEGRWLISYSEKDPRKGDLIRKILMDDMEFSPIEEKRSFVGVLNYAVPLAGGAAGFGISNALSAGVAVRAVSTIAPMVLLYPAVKVFTDSSSSTRREQAINKYLSQLDKYRDSVSGILDDQ